MNSRIAPTPSGFLHRGNAFNFLLTERLVRASHGKLLLRIDDIDKGRYRPAYVHNIFATLDALDIQVDKGPRSLSDLEENWSQHHRLVEYQKVLDSLQQSSRIYACDCSRKKVNAESIAGKYSGYCRTRNLPLDQPNVNWRINVCDTDEVAIPIFDSKEVSIINLESTIGDFVLRKKDGLPAYQICSLADDLLFDIKLIVRGEDLLMSSAIQIWLASLLGEDNWLSQLELLHHPLIKSKSGNKLSKSAGASAILSGQEMTLDFAKASLLRDMEAWVSTTNSDRLKALFF